MVGGTDVYIYIHALLVKASLLALAINMLKSTQVVIIIKGMITLQGESADKLQLNALRKESTIGADMHMCLPLKIIFLSMFV